MIEEWRHVHGTDDLQECARGCGATRLPGVFINDHDEDCDIWEDHCQCECNNQAVPNDEECPACGESVDDDDNQQEQDDA